MVRVGQASLPRDNRAAANCAYLGALLFVVSALLYIDGYVIDYESKFAAPGGEDAYRALNVTNLQSRWEGRRQAQGAFMFAEATGAIAWFSLMPPIGSLAALLGGESRSATRVLVNCFNGIALLTLVDLTFMAGTISLVDRLSTWPIIANADESHSRDGGFGALQALEIAFLVGQSRTAWLFAMDELLLMAGWATAAFLIYTSRGGQALLPVGLGHLATFGAFCAFIGFGFQVARVTDDERMNYAAGLGIAVVYMLLLPAWLIWLVMQLRQHSEVVHYTSGTAHGGGVTEATEAGEVELAPPEGVARPPRQAEEEARGAAAVGDAGARV